MHPKSELPAAFAELGLEVPILKALAKIGFQEPSDIQRAMIPLVLEGRDVLGQARTGTGKTAAFGLPVLQKLDPQGDLQALCLVPTRELAVQVQGELERFSAFLEIRCVAVYGGERIVTQLRNLGRKHQFVVGTPGRVMDMMERKILNLSHLRFALLDEVDRMLDIGFRDDIRFILSKISQPHQTVLVSATVDEEIRRLAKSYMKNPQEVNISRDQITVDEIDQYYCSVEPEHKFPLLMKLLEQENPPLMIVFTNTKHGARKLAKKLHAAGVNATEIHGDLEQNKRNRVMDSFRKHKIRLLVATDLASRGIDVSAISHIVNYDIPKDTQAYVHRIGRTARMGARGRAFTFVCRDEGKQLTEVEILINRQIEHYKFDGFDPKPRVVTPREERSPAEPPASTTAVAAAVKPKVTLGAKFKPKRRWRP